EHVYSSTGAPQSSTYYYPLGGRLIGELQGNTTQFFLTDALGSIITTFNAVAGSAAVQGNQLYGPYGTSRYSQGSMGTNKGFTGQYADATGLDYYNSRYYDPVIGRFLSADTVQGDGVGMDPYDYVGGNPETLIDPTGNKFVPAGGGGDPGPPSCDDLCQALKNLPGGSGCGKYCPGNGTQACDPQIGCHTRAVGQGTVYVKVTETHEVDVTTYAPVCYLVFCVSVPTVHKYFITTSHYVQVNVTFGVDVCLSGVVHGCGEEGGDDSDNTDDNHHTKPNVLASDAAGDAEGGGNSSTDPTDPAGGGHRPTDPAGYLAKTRQDLGMPPRSTSPDDGQTLAILFADDTEYWGTNGKKPISFPVNAISKTHAEIDALDQLARARAINGITGDIGTMWVDRPPCPACDVNGGIRSGVRAAGLDRLDIWYPGGTLTIFP
ncbi:MAG TPA: RHS repeat-associated core domain-containing protein, partial [Ktedonobacteraceae bacterium]|nr:RHS repeat-associated core domain-containing protein [Ktedonobacteraceae bacterium]